MPSENTAYSRRDYDRYVDRALGWLGAGATCIVAGGLVTSRFGLSGRTVSVAFAGAATCFGMAVYETWRDFKNSRR